MAAIDYRQYSVLIVDDEPANIVAMQYSLGDDFTLITTSRPEDALTLLTERDIAVLVADQRMPGLTGNELCAKARVIRPDIVRIIVTAYADLHDAIEAINRGHVSRYLLKPFRDGELVEVIRAAIELVHVQRSVQGLEARLLRSGQTEHATARLIVHELEKPVNEIARGLRRSMELLTVAKTSIADQPELAKEIVAVCEEEQRVCTELIERLSAGFSLLASGADVLPEAPKRCDVARTVDLTVRLLRPELPANVDLQLVAENEPMVGLDAAVLGQVVTNLVLNAAEAVAGQNERGRPSVVVRTRADNLYAYVSVEDNGPGVPPDLVDRIFDPFFSTKPTGNGLGLAVARSLLSPVRGSIEVHNAPTGGSVFTIRLPLVRPS